MKEGSMAVVRRGYLLALVAAVTGGTIPVLSKYLQGSTNPAVISGVVFFLSGLMFVPYKPRTLPNRGNIKFILAVGTLGATIAPLLYQYGLQRTTAVNASLLSNGEVFFTAVIAFSFFHERLQRDQLLEGLMIVVGLVVVATNLDVTGVQFVQGLVGNLLVLASTVFWSAENNVLRIASARYGPALVTKYRNLFGGAVVLAAVLLLSLPLKFTPVSGALLILLSVTMGLTSLLSIAALGTIGAVRTLLVFSTTSIFGALFAFLFLGEQITAVQVAGGAVILAGVYLIQRSERASELGEMRSLDPSKPV